MKKHILFGIAILAASAAWAQKSKVRDARDYLSDQNYKMALPLLNDAVAHEETKNNPEAWFLRGMAYLQQAIDTSAKAPQAASESYNSLMKVLSLKPDYGAEINNALYSNALLAFNQGVAFYSTNPAEAYNSFMKVGSIYRLGDGKRFASDKAFAELVVSAKANAAYSAVNAKKDKEALALLSELKGAGNADSTVYQSLIEIYERQKNDAQLLSTIAEARSHFPSSQLFRNLELNYYIRKGKSDVLLGKLEEAAKADPNNGELLFNLANAYEQATFPKDATGQAMQKPSNFSEHFKKAEDTYKRAIAAKPNSPDYSYNMAVLYYEQAADYNRQLGDIKGTSPAEQKKYDDLMAQRDAEFDKALPYFEKAYSLLDGKASSLNADEKVTYQNAMIGLREVYSRKGNKEKTDELKKKLDAVRN